MKALKSWSAFTTCALFVTSLAVFANLSKPYNAIRFGLEGDARFKPPPIVVRKLLTD